MRTARRSPVRSVISGLSLATALALLGAAAPAYADGSSTGKAVHAASVVEKATGTGDVAPSVSSPEAAAKATTGTAAGSVTVVAPRASTGDVKATASDGSSLGLKLTGTKDVTGVKAGSGTVVYSEVAKSTDLAVQPTTDGGARTLVTLKDGSASTEQRFAVNLPEGARLIPDGNGGYGVIKSADGGATMTVGAIEAPWAKDAHGKPVATSYKLDGNQLVQHVEINKGTAFPVVADPKITWGNVTGTAYFTKSETKNIAIYGATAALSVGLLPPPLNVLYQVNAALVTAKAAEARSDDYCLKIKFAAGIFVPGVYSNGCN
ncbi:hypothetical protein [Streptomyces hiroshimensis]|uniref:Uncharacterized protein n=1 Tax=Streptomyces hiroshimensis TaxID=66424 RepID=A0ABQ2Z449_9ACTN|nr:hypothetical protein [Streptomyces hiroshimensis]GGY04418.1 hypothetical protein GCM10010324_58880 [Streptomyces hiroshimensis]